MPTLSIDKSADPGQGTGGGQLRVPLPRMWVPVQPAPAIHATTAPHRDGTWAFRWQPVGDRDTVTDPGMIIVRESGSDAEKPKRRRSAPRKASAVAADSASPLAATPLLSPVAFAREVLGVRLWEKQEEVLTALTQDRRVAVKAGNGLGKGFCAAVAVLWFLHAHHDSAIVLSTAPTFRQVRHILWRQIHRLYRPSSGTLGGKMLDTRWELSDERYAMGLSADSADQFQGFHSPNMFIVVDEAEGVSDEIYEAIESVMTSADPLLLLIGNPTTMEGAFRRAFFEERTLYRTITISALESPNVQAGRVVFPGLTTATWVEERREIWGEENPVYRARVLGEFPEQGDDTLFSLRDIEAAVDRLPPGPSPEGDGTEPVILAVDVARFGSDRSVILRRRGDRVEDIQILRKVDTMQLAGRVSAAIREHEPTQLCIDEVGVGAGVVDRLRELGHSVRGVNVANKARQEKTYMNLRAEGYWTLAERFSSGRISIPSDNQLIGELAAMRYGYDNQTNRLKIESKDEMRKRGLRSPDIADALMLAFLPPANRVQLWT